MDAAQATVDRPLAQLTNLVNRYTTMLHNAIARHVDDGGLERVVRRVSLLFLLDRPGLLRLVEFALGSHRI